MQRTDCPAAETKGIIWIGAETSVRLPIHLDAAGELYLHGVLSESELCQKILPLWET